MGLGEKFQTFNGMEEVIHCPEVLPAQPGVFKD
jgi:hypothetical protein